MNIFVLSQSPLIAARHQCDKHVVKMVLESAQLLCSPFEPGVAPYRRTHYNHRCSVWARRSQDNYVWLLRHALALSEEYTFRYGKTHKSHSIIEWCKDNYHQLKFKLDGLTPFAQAMPEAYKQEDVVKAYRAYYLGDKAYFAKWARGRKAPSWWTTGMSTSSSQKLQEEPTLV